MPGSILENIIVDDNGIPDFTDDTLTANTRGSYPIESIENRKFLENKAKERSSDSI